MPKNHLNKNDYDWKNSFKMNFSSTTLSNGLYCGLLCLCAVCLEPLSSTAPFFWAVPVLFSCIPLYALPPLPLPSGPFSSLIIPFQFHDLHIHMRMHTHPRTHRDAHIWGFHLGSAYKRKRSVFVFLSLAHSYYNKLQLHPFSWRCYDVIFLYAGMWSHCVCVLLMAV